MAYDPNRSLWDQAQEILAEEGVELTSGSSTSVVLDGSNLKEAAEMLIKASEEIPFDHIINCGRPLSRPNHEGE
jgi:hypothetical protein